MQSLSAVDSALATYGNFWDWAPYFAQGQGGTLGVGQALGRALDRVLAGLWAYDMVLAGLWALDRVLAGLWALDRILTRGFGQGLGMTSGFGHDPRMTLGFDQGLGRTLSRAGYRCG